ncbi:copper chaperone PCu(A)C [Methylophilus sp.]|uniref:copper chaperone PCu(A)C n=1 Tax=Methylophilus sp. TaxID=29541 RepID=UPI0040354C22
MKSYLSKKSYLAHALVIICMAGFAVLAHAELKVSNAWVKPTVAGQPVAGAYMTLTADKDSELIEVLTPVAEKAEIHSMSMDGNIMRMKRLDRLPLKAGQVVALKPGGFHIMLTGLNHQIKQGEVVPLSLVTRDAHGKKTTITIKVVAAVPETAESAGHVHMHH